MRSLSLLLPLVALLATPARAVTIDWVHVGNPGNPPDAAVNCNAADCGSVPYEYEISRYEVTNAQYAEFLNAVADEDPNGLWDPAMASDEQGGITRSGSPGAFTYAVKSGRGNQPVVFVSFYDALRFANWLDNGQPVGPQGPATTEDGSYTLTPEGIDTNTITRNPGIGVVVPNENEWYKAAYYSPAGVYFDYPMGSDAAPSSDPPPGGPSSANFYEGGFAVGGNHLANVGSYGAAASPYGTYDQGGNVLEWTETIAGEDFRRARGGSWDNLVVNLGAQSQPLEHPSTHTDYLGFRVALSVPEPEASAPALLGMAALVARRRLRARRA